MCSSRSTSHAPSGGTRGSPRCALPIGRNGTAYGLWSLVVINIAIFAIFAYGFTHPRTSRDWCAFGAFSGFLVWRCSWRAPHGTIRSGSPEASAGTWTCWPSHARPDGLRSGASCSRTSDVRLSERSPEALGLPSGRSPLTVRRSSWREGQRPAIKGAADGHELPRQRPPAEPVAELDENMSGASAPQLRRTRLPRRAMNRDKAAN